MHYTYKLASLTLGLALVTACDHEDITPRQGELIDPIACGGFGGLECPDGLTCVDDPADDCDPNKGGADCIGVCEPTPIKHPPIKHPPKQPKHPHRSGPAR